MPKHDDITEEGFGAFRGTWFIGRVPWRAADETVRREAQILKWLDDVSLNAEMFDQLAHAIECRDATSIPASELTPQLRAELEHVIGPENDYDALDSLEIGVAGLTLALSAVGCLTAASCRSHSGDRSWSDCPVVLFAAPQWRVRILAEFIAAEHCGLGADRDMLTVYAASVRDLHRLAERLIDGRARFRKRPDHERAPRAPTLKHEQMRLLDDS